MLLSAAMIILCLLTSACMSTGSSQGNQKALPPDPSTNPPVTPPVQTTETPVADNVTTVHAIPPPAIICNCPMEPVGPVTVSPTPTPDNGLCHCP
ncbi:MAG: hypothetical protein ACLQMU_11210 [Methanoregula sp.]|uniref:hypothetical protein n=1 Tax=Methanoregula sp. TaxID=2052170 RepID=UPI003C716DC0